MKSLVIYDSNFGNTKTVAEVIGQALGPECLVVQVDHANPESLAEVELLVVGSPINGWRPTNKIMDWLGELKANQLTGKKAAAFDTRVRLFIHGNAAKIIDASLAFAGATIVGQPAGFIVKGKEGPLDDGEIERAREWARGLLK
jgi:flavodoxin